MNYHLLFKILLAGDAEVGKSAPIHPAGEVSHCSSIIGVDFLKKKLEIGKGKLNATSLSFLMLSHNQYSDLLSFYP